MLPSTARDGLYRLSTYLEELEAGELKKFKLFLGIAEDLSQDKIPWGRMEKAGPLEMAQLMVAHMGTREAWLLALSTFQRIHRKDLWERGQGEDLSLQIMVYAFLRANQRALWMSLPMLQEKIYRQPTKTMSEGNSS